MTNPTDFRAETALLQAASLKRCASCERWQGPRRAIPGADAVDIEAIGSTGICDGGPWNGELRRARSACGHWLRWNKLDEPMQPT